MGSIGGIILKLLPSDTSLKLSRDKIQTRDHSVHQSRIFLASGHREIETDYGNKKKHLQHMLPKGISFRSQRRIGKCSYRRFYSSCKNRVSKSSHAEVCQ